MIQPLFAPPAIDGDDDEPLVPGEESVLPTPTADTVSVVSMSARKRRPRQLFTYETLGEPSMQPHPIVTTVAALTSPYIPAWETPYNIPPPTGFALCSPYSYMP